MKAAEEAVAAYGPEREAVVIDGRTEGIFVLILSEIETLVVGEFLSSSARLREAGRRRSVPTGSARRCVDVSSSLRAPGVLGSLRTGRKQSLSREFAWTRKRGEDPGCMLDLDWEFKIKTRVCLGSVEATVAYAHESRTFSNGLKLFNIDNAVGANSNNLAGDVMLVQWFINKLRQHPLGLSGNQLDIDGDCGRKTKEAIKETQQQLRDLGDSVSVDGRLDPISLEFPKEDAYALFRMQVRCDSLYGDQTWKIDPFLAPDSPPRLRFAIRGYTIITYGGGV